MINSQPQITCFGEVLWDIFPEGKKAGGAPFNVTYQLKKLGMDTTIISRTGRDELGAELLGLVKSWQIPVNNCQADDTFSTGTVLATIDEHNEAHYDIVANVAWDHIAVTGEAIATVRSASAFVFGTLAARSETSRSTLYRLLEEARYKVFDVNLRPPHYSEAVLTHLLNHTDLIKLNKAELRGILDMFDEPYTTEEAGIRFIEQNFGIREAILTKGSKGALYYGNGMFHFCPAIPVTIQDTVGSGDSFLAAFLASRLCGESVEETLFNAAAMGAFITTQSGACPDYTLTDFLAFRQQMRPAFLERKTAPAA